MLHSRSRVVAWTLHMYLGVHGCCYQCCNYVSFVSYWLDSVPVSKNKCTEMPLNLHRKHDIFRNWKRKVKRSQFDVIFLSTILLECVSFGSSTNDMLYNFSPCKRANLRKANMLFDTDTSHFHAVFGKFSPPLCPFPLPMPTQICPPPPPMIVPNRIPCTHHPWLFATQEKHQWMTATALGDS